MNEIILTVEEFDRLADLIYNKSGIRFEHKKAYFVTKRLQKRMEELGVESPMEYIRLLKYSDKDGVEFQKFLNSLTVNETYFFRDYPQLAAFAEHCLYDLVEKKYMKNDNSLRIWSAGCSTGEEPYTLSIILHEMLDNLPDWNIEIIANDVDENALQKATEGVYEDRSIKDVPQEYLDKYFIRYRNNFIVKEKVKSLVKFEYLNFADGNILKGKRNFDFIFCRNVLIYFDDFSRKKVVDHFYIALNKGGYIFLSSSESLSRITTTFKLKRLGGHLVYTKE